MDSSSPMGSLIGFDAATLGTPGAVNRGRRSTDRVDGASFAEVYDLAAYASTGSRSAARVVTAPQPQALRATPLRPVALQPVPAPASGFSITPTDVPSTLTTVDRVAADRLYLHLTTGGSWLRVADEGAVGVAAPLHHTETSLVRDLRMVDLGDDQGPEVA